MRAAAGTAVAVVALALLAAAPSAEAGYPGKPGVIAFDGDFPALPDDEVQTMPSTGGPFTRLTFDVLGNVQQDEEPAYSGDGKRIVWECDTAFPPGGDSELCIMNADGSGQTQLTPTSATGQLDQDPALSWDGRRIVFERNDPVAPNDDEIFVMNADGSGQTQLTFNGVSDQEPVFSRDGRTIYFESNLDDPVSPEIWAMSADGSGLRQLTSGPGFSGNLDVSPDDRRIVFTSSRTGTAEIFVMNANGSGQAQLSFDPDETETARCSHRTGRRSPSTTRPRSAMTRSSS